MLPRTGIAFAVAFLWATTSAVATYDQAVPHQHHRCHPEFLRHLLPGNASVLFTQLVPANGTFAEYNATNAGYPTTTFNLPALCAVKIHVPTSNTSAFDFALFLPEEWSFRLMTVGNGGFAGFINWVEMSAMAHYGFASMSTNTGHYSADLESSWALNQPESIIDWGYRAVHESVVLSKRVVSGYYGRETSYSYMSSCSNGGRQGLKELTAFPEDFDGVIAGAPAWDIIGVFLWMADFIIPNLLANSSAHISSAQFAAIHQEVISQCDPQDGVIDGIVSDPGGCRFIPETLLCHDSSNQTCLSAPQLETLYHFLRDWSDTNGTFIFPTLELSADLSVLGVQVVDIVNSSFPIGFLRNFVYNDTSYSIEDFDYLYTVRDSVTLYDGSLNVDPDGVDTFQARGGKLLHYHGLADPLISPRESVRWWSEMQRSFVPRGEDVEDWYRLFTIPGMGHCSGSDVGAPWYIGGADQQPVIPDLGFGVPGFRDAEHDVILAMVRWVEEGLAPEELVATRWVNDTVALGVDNQRPLCPYPRQAIFGKGKVNEAESWSCEEVLCGHAK